LESDIVRGGKYMKILTRENVILFYGEVEKGIFPEADPTRELYKINGNMYSVTDGIIEYDVDNIPEDFVQVKYCYTEEKGFYLNTEYIDPEEPSEEEKQIRQQRADIDYIALMSGVMLEDYPIMPTDDYSYKYHDIKKYYDNNLWSTVRVRNMVVKNIITAEEYQLITKEEYV
jgi:hypothetical protein